MACQGVDILELQGLTDEEFYAHIERALDSPPSNCDRSDDTTFKARRGGKKKKEKKKKDIMAIKDEDILVNSSFPIEAYGNIQSNSLISLFSQDLRPHWPNSVLPRPSRRRSFGLRVACSLRRRKASGNHTKCYNAG